MTPTPPPSNSYEPAPSHEYGEPAHPAPASPPASGRRSPWLLAGCGLLIALMMLVLGSCSTWLVLRDGEGSAGGTTSAPEDPTTTEEPTADAPTGAGPTGTSPQSPAPAGTTATIPAEDGGVFEVTFGAPDWGAEEKILAANPENPPAPDGQVYMLLPVAVRYLGEGPVPYWDAVAVDFIEGNGETHLIARGVTSPRLSFDMGDFTDMKTGQHDLVFLVPEGIEGPGVAYLHQATSEEGSPVYVELHG